MTDNEFENYDACTADALMSGDIIFHDGEYHQIRLCEDIGINILVDTVVINTEEPIEEPIRFEPDQVIDLFRLKDG